MENERKIKIISLAAVIVAVIGLTIAFAAMSRTLKINGSGNVDPANFDIYFDNLSSPVTEGQAQTSGTPSLATKGAEISNINVTLKQPKDSVTYTVDIVNEGDVDAEISNITLPTLTNREHELIEFNADYTSEQENGTHIISVGDMLYKNERKNITITFKYKDITDESKLPSNPEEITLSYAIQYVQSNKVSTTTTQAAGNNYGEEIASRQISENITATYYGGTPIAKANTSGVMAMSNNTLADDVRYEGGTLVILGSGVIPDETFDVQMFLADVSTVEELMEKYDEEMYDGAGAFNLKYNPTNLVIEEGITRIGELTLSGITSLYNIDFPSTLIEIGPDQLGNTNITSLRIPYGVTSIGLEAFSENYYLEEVYIPSTVLAIGQNAFVNIKNNSIIYCETQEVANLFVKHTYSESKTQVIVDPTKFN